MKFPRDIWIKISHEELCKQMEYEYVGPEDAEAIFMAILARIESAEEWADRRAVNILLNIQGLELE